jgi:hypothetical protein
VWNFDGSSTGQAPGEDSEVMLRPCRIFKDPFRPRDDGVDNVLVMCDCWTPAGEALPSNHRAVGKHSFDRFLSFYYPRRRMIMEHQDVWQPFGFFQMPSPFGALQLWLALAPLWSSAFHNMEKFTFCFRFDSTIDVP